MTAYTAPPPLDEEPRTLWDHLGDYLGGYNPRPWSPTWGGDPLQGVRHAMRVLQQYSTRVMPISRHRLKMSGPLLDVHLENDAWEVSFDFNLAIDNGEEEEGDEDQTLPNIEIHVKYEGVELDVLLRQVSAEILRVLRELKEDRRARIEMCLQMARWYEGHAHRLDEVMSAIGSIDSTQIGFDRVAPPRSPEG